MNPKKKILTAAITLAALLALPACVSTPPPPNEAIQAAELAIVNAEQSRVAEFGSTELKDAREKLAQAKTAVADKKMTTAMRLAEQSRVDADLATARSNEAKARAVNDDMRKSSEMLKQEMQRNQGVQP